MGTDTMAEAKAETTVERTSDREAKVTRHFKAPPRLVFEAWSNAEHMQTWWAPKSFGIRFVSCEADVRTGGSYKFVMGHPGADEPMTFFGRYLEVTPPSKIVWTNDEAGEAGQVTTVTFEDHEGGTRLTLQEAFPTKEALDEAMANQSMCGYGETFDQLDAFLAGRS